jgi:hypothetical protein
MRTSLAGATFLLVGAGAFAVGAAPYTGNNLTLNGSDTIFQVTQQVIANCPGMVGSNDTYAGGGSGVGAGQMDLGLQQIAPMSRALKSTEFCGISIDNDGDPTTPPVPVQGSTEGLVIALDGVAVFANTNTSCAGTGVNQTGVITVTADGTATGAAVINCHGCAAGTNLYTLASSIDALKIAYGGAEHDGTQDCADPVRLSLVNNWGNIFSTSCAGQATCTQLRHIWRRSDLSGTTDAFQGALGISGRGIGSLPNVPNPSRNRNPFCNSLDANPNSTRATIPTGQTSAAPACTTTPLTTATCPNGSVCAAGSLCNASNVCVTNACTMTPCAAGQVCRPDGQCVVTSCPGGTGGPYGATLQTVVGGQVGNSRACDGPNGLCTFSFGGSSDFSDLDPIRRPCDAAITSADQACEADGTYGAVTVVLLPDAAGITATDEYPQNGCDAGAFNLSATGSASLACPNGPQFVGKCFMPYHADATVPGGQDFNCFSKKSAKAFGSPSGADGRVWNYGVRKADTVSNPPRFGAFVKDANGRLMTQANYRWHTSNTLGAPTCQLADDTSQIGCLVTADNCSIGYAGREADQQAGNQSLLINGIGPTDQNIINLLTATPPVYPIARRLNFATLIGFSQLKGGENELAKCFADNTIVATAASAHFFVPMPSPGEVCIDYDETAATNATPFPGCAAASNTDSCRVNPPGPLADDPIAFPGSVSSGGTAVHIISHPITGGTRAAVQTLVNNRCVTCHNATTLAGGMDLTDIGTQIGTPAGESTKARITAGDATNSYLADKILGMTQTVGTGISSGPLASGARMPNAAAGLPQLSPSDINLILAWIANGAP